MVTKAEATPPETIIPLYDYDADEILAGKLKPGRYTTKARLDEQLKAGVAPSIWYGSKNLSAELDKMRRRKEIIDVTDYSTARAGKVSFFRVPSVDEATQYERYAKGMVTDSVKKYLDTGDAGAYLTKQSGDFYLGLIDKQVSAMRAGKSKSEVNQLVKDAMVKRREEVYAERREQKQSEGEAKGKAKEVVGEDNPGDTEWFNNTGLTDIEGIDTPRRNKKHKKKVKPRIRHSNPVGVISPRW